MKRPFQVQPIIEIRDMGDNIVKSSTLAIKIELLTASTATIWNDVVELRAVEGVAYLADLPCRRCVGLESTGIALSQQGYNLQLQFSTVLGVTTATTVRFDMGTWPPFSMALSNYPKAPCCVGGVKFDQQPLIRLLDLDGIDATWDPGEKLYIGLSLNGRNNEIPTNIRGTTMIEIVRGRAQFTDLRHDYMATMYNLRFNLISSTVSTVQQIQSPLFDISHGVAFQLSLGASYGYPPANGTQPGGFRAGDIMLTQPVVLVLDSVGNMLWETSILVTAHLFTAKNETVPDHGFLFNSTRTEISCPLFKGVRDCSKCIATTRIPATCGTVPFTDLRVDYSYEPLVLRFSSPGLRSVDSKPFQVPEGEAYKLFIEQPPLGFKYNTALRQQPVITVKDRGNNTIRFQATNNPIITAQLCIGNTSSISEPVRCAEMLGWASIVKGVARFTDLKIKMVGLNTMIRFCAEPVNLICTSSVQFEVTEDPTMLVVRTNPAYGIPGLSFTVAPVVQIGDMFNSTTTWAPRAGLVVNCTLCVRLPHVKGPTNFTVEEWKCAPDERWLKLNALSTCDYRPPDPLQKLLMGPTSQQVVEGLATFSDLRIDRKGTYKLKFTAGGLIEVDSSPFDVAIGDGDRLSILVEADGAEPGRVFQTQPMVAVVDRGGNNVESDHGTQINATLWTVDTKINLGLVPTHFISPSHSIGFHNATQWTRFGVAIFEGLRIDDLGTYIIRYETELYTGVDSSPLQVNVGIGIKLNIIYRPTGCCARAACNFRQSADPTCITVPVLSILDLGANTVAWNGVKINATVFARPEANTRVLQGLQSFFATSDRKGRVTFTDFGMDRPGNYTVRFSNISPYIWRTRHPDGSWTNTYYWNFTPIDVNFSVSGRLSQLELEVPPSDIIPGAPMAQQPIVILQDAHGYVVDHDMKTSVIASVIDCTGTLVLLGGRKSVQATPTVVTKYSDHGGRVFFTDLRIDLARKCVRMHFSAPSYGGGTIKMKSLAFNVMVGQYHRIQVIQQPGQAVIGSPFGIQPHVALTDFGGNIVDTDSKTYVTASVFRRTVIDIRSAAGKQILLLKNGQAQFEDLRTNVATPCMQLEILAVGRLPGYSIPFQIKPALPYRVEFLDDESRDWTPIQYGPAEPRPGLPLLQQPMIKVEDKFGNRIGAGGGLFGGVTATLLENGLPAQCSYLIKHCLIGTNTAVYDEFDGIARFTNLQIDRANMFGNYSFFFVSNDLKNIDVVGNSSFSFFSLLPVESNRELVVIPGTRTVALEVVVEPDKFMPGLPMKTTPVIGVVDPGGNVVPTALPTTISCSVRAENFWWLELIGEKVILAFNGLETFEGLGVNTTARKVTLTFDAAVVGLGVVDSFSFDVSGPIRRLELLEQTMLSRAGEIFSIDSVVRGFDEDNLTVTTFGHPPFPLDLPDIITVAFIESESIAYCKVVKINDTTIVTGDVSFNATKNATIDNRFNTTINNTTVCFGDRRLQGTNQSTYSYGLANFTDLRIDLVGTYHLQFTVPVLNISVVSQPIVITNARASELRLITQVQGPKEATFPVKQAPEAMILDRFGNLVLDTDFTVVATFFQGLLHVPAIYVQGTLKTKTSKAIASFNEAGSALRLSLAGTGFSIRLSVQGLPSIFTAPFDVPVGVPYRMRVLSMPTHFFEKEPFSDEPSFEVLDRGDNLVKPPATVTLSLWNMRGCEKCTNVTNFTTSNNVTTIRKTTTSCTNSQEVFAREYDSNRLPCGKRVSGLYIVQPFCLAEYLSDTATNFCADVLKGNDTSGLLNRINKEGNFMTKWYFQSSLEMRITAYLYNSSYNTTVVNTTNYTEYFNSTPEHLNATSNTTVNIIDLDSRILSTTTRNIVTTPSNSSTFYMLSLRYSILLVSNGTRVRGLCNSNVSGLPPRLYYLSDWEPIDKRNVREFLSRSNLTLANLTTECAPKILDHNCTKYNFTVSTHNGKGSFSGVTLMSPSTEDLKLRLTFMDREYTQVYSVSTQYVGPGYRQFRQDIVPPALPVHATTSVPVTTPSPQLIQIDCSNTNATNTTGCKTSLVSTPVATNTPLTTTPIPPTQQSTDRNNTNATGCNATNVNTNATNVTHPTNSIFFQNVIDYPLYHIMVETQNFQVSGPPTALEALSLPGSTTTGGTPFSIQPSFKIVDSGGRLVTKELDIRVTATLLADGKGKECTVATPYRCPMPTDVCALDVSYCPKLRGTAIIPTNLGFVAFSDLSITVCNDIKVPYYLCVFGDFSVQFNATSYQQSVQIGQGFMSTPADASLQGLVSGAIDNFIGPPAVLFLGVQPVGGVRAGERLPTQPNILTQDAGGNRIVSTPVKITVLLSAFNQSLSLQDYSDDGIKGTRSVGATYDGTFKWTDLSIDRSNPNFILNFVQFDTVPGFPKAPTITSVRFVIEAGIGVKLAVDIQPAFGIGGEPFEVQPTLSVLDKKDNIVVFDVYNVSVRLSDESRQIGGTLTKARIVSGIPVYDTRPNSLEVTTVKGRAHFNDLIIDKVGHCYQLVFSAKGLADAVSDAFDVRSGPVRQVRIIRQPAGAEPGQVIKSQPLVHLSDWGKNPSRYNRDQVEITLIPGKLTANNTQELKLYGNNLVRCRDGILEFTDLIVYHAGVGFSLLIRRYVGGMADIISAPFNVHVGISYRIRITTQPFGAASGKFLHVQPRVQVEDAGGNRVITGLHVITAMLFRAGEASNATLRGPECSVYQCAGQTWSNTTQAIRAVCPTCVTTNVSAGRDLVTTVASERGISQFTALAIANVGKDYTIRFVSYLLLSAESDPPMSVVAGLPVRLEFEREPRGFISDTAFRVQPIIMLVDLGGNLITSSPHHLITSSPNRAGVVAVTLERPEGSQLLPVFNTRVNMIRGRAKFVKLKVDKAGVGFTMLFTGNFCTNTSGATDVPCISARSLPFNVTGPRTHVENMVQVETSILNELLRPQPQVHLLDAQNRVVGWDSGRLIITVEIDPATNTKNATLLGTLRVPCCEGVCAFTDLVIDKALVGYRLLFSGPPLVRLVSPLFNVTGPRHLCVSRQPIAYATGEPFVVQPHVDVLDIYREPLSGYWLTISAQILKNSGPTGGMLIGTTSVFSNESTVVFTDLALNGYGSSYVLEFSCLWFETVTSHAFDVDATARPHVCKQGSEDVCTAP